MGTLTQPAGKITVIPCPVTVMPPDCTCDDVATGVLLRLAGTLRATRYPPKPSATATAPATKPINGRRMLRIGRGVTAGLPPSRPDADSGLRSVMATSPLPAAEMVPRSDLRLMIRPTQGRAPHRGAHGDHEPAASSRPIIIRWI